MRQAIILLAALLLGGCATTYQVTLMPRDSGKLYSGTASDDSLGEGRMAVTIEGKAYNGTWVAIEPERLQGYVSGGWGWGGRRPFWGLGTMVTVENPNGARAKALLTAGDGSGLRCDLRSGHGRGGGVCKDDGGKEYDVQLRPASKG